jgi:hypothetical protein
VRNLDEKQVSNDDLKVIASIGLKINFRDDLRNKASLPSASSIGTTSGSSSVSQQWSMRAQRMLRRLLMSTMVLCWTIKC